VSAVLVILTAVTVGQEFSSGTFRALVARGVSRWKPLVVQWTVLVLAGGLLLAAVEALAVGVGVRTELHPAELGRAWLALWPLVSLVMLWAVLARSGGLPMMLGILLLAMEEFYALMAGLISQFAELPGFPAFLRTFSTGWIGHLYQQTWSYNAANWTYLAQWQRAPVMVNLVFLSLPRAASLSALVLAAFTVLGLGLSLGLVYRRELTETVVAGPRRRARRERREQTGSLGPGRLPLWTGRGPAVVRLAYAHLWHLGRTSLVKIGAAVGLLFPLSLLLLTWAAGDADMLFGPQPRGSAPLALSACMFLVAPLAVVLACLAMSEEFGCGTRRASLARGVTRLQAIVGESAAWVGLTGLLLVWLMLAVLVLSVVVGGVVPLGTAALAVGVGMLGAAVYAGAVQVGAAITRSALGALLAGLGFLAADWLAFILPTTMSEPGPALHVARYTLTALAIELVNGQPLLASPLAVPPLLPAAAVGLLAGLAVAAHALAALITARRDA
jgi:hypothetical protein